MKFSKMNTKKLFNLTSSQDYVCPVTQRAANLLPQNLLTHKTYFLLQALAAEPKSVFDQKQPLNAHQPPEGMQASTEDKKDQ